jgi:D-amino-acid dehydrogenase
VKVLVPGAGVVGVASPRYLAEAGHEVSVVERQPRAAMETSFANGGQISAGHAEPWAKPSVLPKILRWLGRGRRSLRGAGTSCGIALGCCILRAFDGSHE